LDQKRSYVTLIVKTPRLWNTEMILESAREKWELIYKDKIIRITSTLSAETLKYQESME
jgi:hypothetical protein